ncbi:U4/U6 small nuclear ribonucleoprotein Prp31 [Phytophthora palmivora]|uniref:U4/U6 small nuclear ribonucleoprotein Prp31 n=1 Tax=Phytophthora palmivora TaxID=4796 RepID=A0A2P4YDC3_9STRA|nr:U4/U6 small nuclear ribonucleoprotein Prp31 [Phytophthora palmivora]
MSTLADSFLEDLDELSGGSSDEEETLTSSSVPGVASAADAEAQDDDDDEQMLEVPNASQSRATKRKRPTDVEQDFEQKTEDLAESLRSSVKERGVAAVATLKRSPKYLDHVQKIQRFVDVDDSSAAKPQPLEEGSVEYDLVVTSNDLMVQIDDEIEAVHRFIAEIYAAKFPELDSLVPNALDYARVVKAIGNEMDLTLVEELPKLLPSSAVIGISVTGSGTSGKPLGQEDLKTCMEACDELLSLDKDKNMILRFVESRMNLLDLLVV